MSDMIIINEEICTGCRACAVVCSKKILEIVNNKATVLSFADWECSMCGQCMAVCPNQSISIEGLDYNDFSTLPENNVSYQDFNDLLSSRRSIRSFEDKQLDNETIKKILEASKMAPIGAPPSNVKVLVISNYHDLDSLYEDIIKDWKKLIKNMKNPIYRYISKRIAGASKYNSLIHHGLPAGKVYCDYADKGRNVITFDAPTIIMFYGEKLGVCINENCWLSCSYATIAAHSLGLGGTLSGMIPPILNMNKKLKQQLGIPKNDDVFACLMLGYPSKRIRFKRKIPRDFKSVNILRQPVSIFGLL